MNENISEYVHAISALIKVIKEGRSLDKSFPAEISPLGKQVTYGVLRDYYRLDFLIGELLKKPLQSKHLDLKMLLFCGIYSINSLNRPGHASVNAVVDTTRLLKKDWARGLINAVLRNYIRQSKQFALLTPDNPGKNIEVKTNHPAWLFNKINEAWSDKTDQIIEANNQKPPMVLRVNQQRSTRDSYLEQLRDENIDARPGSLVESSIILNSPCPVSQLPGFDDGVVSVQDEASQIAANLLSTNDGDTVLDACAAPGGKTCHLLEKNPAIQLIANDKSEDRLSIIGQNLKRLNLNCELVALDLLEFTGTTFNKILLDAPCSATGIIRRHPDIKMLRKNTDIAKLCAMQARLLTAAWGLLEKGGEILYSTCSILPEENEDMVRKFIDQRDDVEVLPIPIQSVRDAGIKLPIGLQLLPTVGSHDGFYYAYLRRT
jgi:16S rRNA (cytosine967-C5)-methyltransferase